MSRSKVKHTIRAVAEGRGWALVRCGASLWWASVNSFLWITESWSSMGRLVLGHCSKCPEHTRVTRTKRPKICEVCPTLWSKHNVEVILWNFPVLSELVIYELLFIKLKKVGEVDGYTKNCKHTSLQHSLQRKWLTTNMWLSHPILNNIHQFSTLRFFMWCKPFHNCLIQSVSLLWH